MVPSHSHSCDVHRGYVYIVWCAITTFSTWVGGQYDLVLPKQGKIGELQHTSAVTVITIVHSIYSYRLLQERWASNNVNHCIGCKGDSNRNHLQSCSFWFQENETAWDQWYTYLSKCREWEVGSVLAYTHKTHHLQHVHVQAHGMWLPSACVPLAACQSNGASGIFSGNRSVNTAAVSGSGGTLVAS